MGELQLSQIYGVLVDDNLQVVDEAVAIVRRQPKDLNGVARNNYILWPELQARAKSTQKDM